MVFTSKSNPLIKKYASLKEKKFRLEHGLFLAEGFKMVKEVLGSPMRTECVIVSEEYQGERYTENCIEVSAPVFSYLSDERTPQGILAVVKIPERRVLPPKGNCLLLDGIRDPGNLGTILRTANAAGYKASKCTEIKIAKAAAALTYAFADATVPKVNVVTGKAYGSAYVTMNSKGLGADVVYAWPKAEIGMMDAKLAAKVMYADADAKELKEKAAAYSELQNNVASAAKRGYVDTVIDAQDTRKYVIGAFEMLYTKREDRPGKKHGTV